MADDIDEKLKIPSADELKQTIDHKVEMEMGEINKLLQSTLDGAVKNDKWPAKIPLKDIPERHHYDLEMALYRKGYKTTRDNEYITVQKPE